MSISSFETLSFYRGVSDRYELANPTVFSPRNDREPRDSSHHFHKAADLWFRLTFGVSYRSQASFVTSEIAVAAHYGASRDHVMRVVPISTYTYCWSPLVADLLSLAVELATAPEKVIHERLTSCQYRQDSLAQAQESGNEVMLHCEKIMLIPIQLLGLKVEKDEIKIIY